VPLIATPAIGSSRPRQGASAGAMHPCGESDRGGSYTAPSGWASRSPATPWSSGGPTGTDPDIYGADHGRAMDMAVARYTELYGEAPEAEIIGKLAMVSDLEDDELGCAARHGSGTSGTDRLPGRGAV
jgi:hypothetical protein